MTGHRGATAPGTATRRPLAPRPVPPPRTRHVLTSALGRYRPHSTTVLRVSVGLVFIAFGLMKFIPGASPAEDVATRTMKALTFGLVPAEVSRPMLALFEAGIGIGLVTGILLRPVLILFFLHMIGVFSALLVLPGEMWDARTGTPTLEGQYILKNVVLIAACLSVAVDLSSTAGGRPRTGGRRRRGPAAG
ncbi:DoxX family protein [Streptomyces yaizuensis]|uniref:DoxX family protein n=1 Tax=Streptomyces yaizuensis TaxID=2989713 RepID=A0ABQ5NT79_9ACTN|nr:DoxX family membrane protein [Streptomyces sp. YSPA8]GLF93353.1 DoxX family protein [Streptomyces sp. YSPA8]